MKIKSAIFLLGLTVLYGYAEEAAKEEEKDQKAIEHIEVKGVSWPRVPRITSVQILQWGSMERLSRSDFIKGETGESEDTGPDCSGSADGGGTSNAGATAGNPIVIASGRKVETVTDFIGNESFALRLVRHYASDNQHVGVFGKGWSSVFDKRIDITNKIVISEDNSRVNLQAGSFYIPGIGNVSGWQSETGKNYLYQITSNRWLFRHENNKYEVYDAQGKLLHMSESVEAPIVSASGVITAKGIYHQFVYSSGLLSQVVHANGRKLTLAWQNGKVSSVSDTAGNRYQYSYDAKGMLSKVTHPDTNTTTYHYEDSRFPTALTGITFNGSRYSWFTYNSQGKAYISSHGNKNDRYQFDFGGTYTKVTNPLGHVTTYRYRDLYKNKLVGIDRASGVYCASAAQLVHYDSATGFKESETDWNGNITRFYYDASGQVNKLIKALNKPEQSTIAYDWYENNTALKTIVEENKTTTFTYDEKHNVKTIEVTADGISRLTRYDYTYYDNYVVKSLVITLPDGRYSTYHYDILGNQTSFENEAGHITRYSNYDVLGNVRRIDNPDGTAVLLNYDTRSRVKQHTVRSTSGQLTHTYYTYNAYGKVSSETDSAGNAVHYDYDNNARLFQVRRTTSQGEYKKQYGYNKLGNVVIEQDYAPGSSEVVCVEEPYMPPQCHTVEVASRQSHYLYTELGQVREIRDAAYNVVAKYTYDANGNRLTATDGKGNTTHYSYDALNRLVSQTDANGKITHFAQKETGLGTVQDARNNLTGYNRNALSQVETLTSPDTNITHFNYDVAGRLDNRTDARNIFTRYEYDTAGRINRKVNATTHSWGYDSGANATGKLTSINDDSGSTSYQYGPWGSLTGQTSVIAGASYQTNWGYDAHGRVSTLTYPGGNKVSYGYDSYGELASLNVTIGGTTRSLISTIKRLPYGPINEWTYGNGLKRTQSFDKNYRLTAITTAGIQSLSYAYDANSNISKISHGITSSYTQSFGYDKLNRLTSISSTGLGSHSFAYDALGNRTTRSGAIAESYAITGTSNRLAKVTRGTQTRVFSYDANGNITNEKRFNGTNFGYVYNNDNRMIKAGTAEYKYNALGQRVYKKVGTAITRFIYNPEGQLLAEGTNKQYIYFQGQVVGYINNNHLYYVHNDHLGRPEVITNQNIGIVWRAKLEAFDRSVLTTSIGDFNIGFPGQYWDAEKLSWYNYFRDYDATTGRYLQSDPIGLAGGLNTYGYVGGNPLIWIDPYGLTPAACLIPPVTGACAAGGAAIGEGLTALGATAIGLWAVLNENQNENRPKDCPSGTLDIDKAKKKYGWDKDSLHGIKDAAHGGMGNGKSWTGVAPDGTVGINEGGHWVPQGHWEQLL